MKKTKKFIPLLSIFLVLLVASSCGGGTSGGNGDEINVCIIEAGIGEEWLSLMADLYYEETGTTVNYYTDIGLDGNLKQSMGVGSAEEDLYLAPNTYDWISWVADDKVEPLTDIAAKKYEDGTTIESKIKEEIAPLGIVKGERYIIQLTYAPTGFVYNADLLQSLGYEEFPDTWNGLLQLCDDVLAAEKTVNGRKVMPFVWGTNTMFDLYKTLWAQGDYEKFRAYFAQDGASPDEELFLSQERLTALEAIYDLLAPDADYSTTSVTGMLGEAHLVAQEAFLQGYAAFCFSGAWFEEEMHSIIDDSTFTYSFADVPALEGNAIAVNINYPTEYFFIPSSASNPEGAKDFLYFMLREDNLIKIHQAMQTPLAFEYDTTRVEYTRWGKECQEVAENPEHRKIIAGASTTRYLSGGIRPEFMSRDPFTLMCQGNGTDKKGIKRENLNTLLIENLGKFRDSWEAAYRKAQALDELL